MSPVPPSTMQPFGLSGRRALVTGGGSGLGLAIARGLAIAGADVIINGRNVEKGLAAVRTLADEGLNIKTSFFDVTDAVAASAAVERIENEMGGIDILVNNAAVNRRAPLVDFEDVQWRDVMAANLDAPFFMSRSVLPGMRMRRRGKIINICSLASDIGRPNIVPYAASKGGLKMLTRALAVEVASHNIQVNGIAPGFFKTEMNAALISDPDFSSWVAQRTPAGRWGEPPEISGAAVFLASSAADYVTGHILYVDGGFSASY